MFTSDPEDPGWRCPLGEWVSVLVRGGPLSGVSPRLVCIPFRLVLLHQGEEIVHVPLRDADGLHLLDRGRPIYVPEQNFRPS